MYVYIKKIHIYIFFRLCSPMYCDPPTKPPALRFVTVIFGVLTFPLSDWAPSCFIPQPPHRQGHCQRQRRLCVCRDCGRVDPRTDPWRSVCRHEDGPQGRPRGRRRRRRRRRCGRQGPRDAQTGRATYGVVLLVGGSRGVVGPAGKLLLSSVRPRIKGHSVIPAPRTTRTQ